jgi:HEAT repeat protein
LSFDTLLQTLDRGALPSSHDLAGLSALDAPGRERFARTWRRQSSEQRRTLIDRLAGLAEDNIELNFDAVFKLGVDDDDPVIRAESIRALWEYPDDDLAETFARRLDDDDESVRAEAAQALGRLLLRAELEDRDDDLVRRVEDALRVTVADRGEAPEVRGRALEALGVRQHEWVTDLIREAYVSDQRRLRLSAVHAMGRSADPDWLPSIIGEMESDDGEMRFEAATAAGSIGDEEAVDALAELTVDDDPEVQEAAIDALGQIGGAAARSALHSVAADSTDSTDERVLEAVSTALEQADFVEDPMGIRLRIEQSVAEDQEDEDENL